MSTADTIQTVTAVVALVQTYGVPAARKLIDELERKGDPTLEEIEALSDMMKDPESYFDKPGG